MLERLSVTDDPEREAVLLAEMLAEDLDDWPDDGWIVIDDYQHLAVSEGLRAVRRGPIVSRSPVPAAHREPRPPCWVHGKAILYGDVLEVTQTMLAMTTEEAGEVLEGGRVDLSSGLLSLADGWPAVIGLAGMAPDVTEIDADMPETLYAFFAEEVYRGARPARRRAPSRSSPRCRSSTRSSRPCSSVRDAGRARLRRVPRARDPRRPRRSTGAPPAGGCVSRAVAAASPISRLIAC